jgi:hypothetical protein
MANFTLDKKALEAGEIICFETIDKDDPRGCQIDKNKKGIFRIWFNGKFIFMSASFSGLQKRFNTLNEVWKLEPTTEEQN